MSRQTTRSKVIQVWFATVTLIAVSAVAFGVTMAGSTLAMLLALSIVPPAILLVMWPGKESATIAEVLHDAERR